MHRTTCRQVRTESTRFASLLCIFDLETAKLFELSKYFNVVKKTLKTSFAVLFQLIYQCHSVSGYFSTDMQYNHFVYLPVFRHRLCVHFLLSRVFPGFCEICKAKIDGAGINLDYLCIRYRINYVGQNERPKFVFVVDSVPF